MKKSAFSILILLIAFIAAAPGANAQFRVGPTVGMTVSNLSFKQDLFKVDPSIGVSGGLVTEMMFPGIGFGIDLGLLYEQRGASLNLGEKLMWESQGYGRERTYLHYLDIPLHLRFKYTNLNGVEDYVAPFAFAGPDFGFLVAHNKLDALEYAAGQVGLSVGAGVELYNHWQVSASYTWGVTYALKMALLSNDSARNNTFNLRVAYLF